MSYSRRRLLIIDGYNVLRSGSRYKAIEFPDYTDDPFNAARERLINDVVGYVGRDMDAVVVYDAAEGYHSGTNTETIGNVKVMFSPIGQSADRIIEKLSHDARERGVETIVVTSDATIQDTVFGGGVDRMSAEGFCLEVATHESDVYEEESPKVAKKNTIGERISPDIAAKLIKMRDEAR